jgi:membrane protein required for colicin V production
LQEGNPYFLHPVDIGLALLLLWGAYKGYKTGLVLVLVNTLALIAAIVLGFRFLAEATELLDGQIKGGKVILPVLAFALVFGLTFFSLKWFAGFASRSLRQTLLGPVDQGAGAVLGLFRMAFILSSVLFGLKLIGFEIAFSGNSELVLLPALQKLGPSSLKILAPLLPFLKKLLEKQGSLF